MEDLVKAVAAERAKLRGWSQWRRDTRERVGCIKREWRNEAVWRHGTERECVCERERDKERGSVAT